MNNYLRPLAILIAVICWGCDDESESVVTCETAGDMCGTHGSCDDSDGNAICVCVTGYAGDTCAACETGYQDNNLDGICLADCVTANLPCVNGSCNDVSGTALCDCNPDFLGDLCDECKQGYQDNNLDGTCLADCVTASLPCVNGSCNDTSGTALCDCHPDFQGALCDQCQQGYQDNDHDNQCEPTCATLGYACSGNGQCDDSSGHADCDCYMGFISDGQGNCLAPPKKTIYTTESAPDLDTSDRFDFRDKLMQANYENAGDTTRCTRSEMKQLLSRNDITTLYHSSHGYDGMVILDDGELTCNNVGKISVQNVIYATCRTLTDKCWKNQMGPTSETILGYTKDSYDGIANRNAKAMGDELIAGKSYIKAWYISNTSINALKDRWCAYVREGSNVVEYSARSGATPKSIERELQAVHADEIIFATQALLDDARDFQDRFENLSHKSYEIEQSPASEATFFLAGLKFLKKFVVSGIESLGLAEAFLGDELPDDAILESKKPIEADDAIVAYRIRYARQKDGLEVRTNGREHHLEVLVNDDDVVAVSKIWPNIVTSNESLPNDEPMLKVKDTVLALADHLADIARNSVAITSVEPCYGSESRGDIVAAHCFRDQGNTIWVVNARTGDLVE